MKKELDIATWNRKAHFDWFRRFEEPFWGMTVDVDCTEAYNYCKSNGVSFFLYYLHKSLVAANNVEEFRYRIDGEKVWIYDAIHASATINREDGTFGFSYIKYDPVFSKFVEVAKAEIDRVRNTTGLEPAVSGENVIHYSSLPWLKFTSLSHARGFSFPDSCPKITFGKLIEVNGRMMMPVAVHIHHALADGLHVGQFVEIFENKLLIEQ